MICRLFPRRLAMLLIGLALLTILTSCKTGSARTSLPSGGWTATADFGRFTFVVSPDSKSITDITFNFVALDVCGAVSSGSIQVGFGSPVPISERAFSIETSIGGGAPSLPPMPGQISIPSVPDSMKITGMFGKDNVSASGNWSALQGGATPCSSGDWTAVPNGSSVISGQDSTLSATDTSGPPPTVTRAPTPTRSPVLQTGPEIYLLNKDEVPTGYLPVLLEMSINTEGLFVAAEYFETANHTPANPENISNRISIDSSRPQVSDLDLAGGNLVDIPTLGDASKAFDMPLIGMAQFGFIKGNSTVYVQMMPGGKERLSTAAELATIVEGRLPESFSSPLITAPSADVDQATYDSYFGNVALGSGMLDFVGGGDPIVSPADSFTTNDIMECAMMDILKPIPQLTIAVYEEKTGAYVRKTVSYKETEVGSSNLCTDIGNLEAGDYQFRLWIGDTAAVALSFTVSGDSADASQAIDTPSAPSKVTAQLLIAHEPNPAKFQPGGASGSAYTCSYKTSVKAVGTGVRIEVFGMLFWIDEQWSPSSTFGPEDFSEWYSCPGAYVKLGQECADPNNWNGQDLPEYAKGKWYYEGIDDNGNRVRGEAVIECFP